MGKVKANLSLANVETNVTNKVHKDKMTQNSNPVILKNSSNGCTVIRNRPQTIEKNHQKEHNIAFIKNITWSSWCSYPNGIKWRIWNGRTRKVFVITTTSNLQVQLKLCN